jgi:hypothetical protein
MPSPRPLIHSESKLARELARLADQADEAQRAVADVGRQERDAQLDVEAATAEYVDAEVSGDRKRITAADKRLAEAKTRATAHWRERKVAADRRAQNARAELDASIAEHRDAIIEELTPEAEQVVDAILEPLRRFLDAVPAWHDLANRLLAVQRATDGDPRAVPSDPGLGTLDSDVRRLLDRAKPVRSPLPAPVVQDVSAPRKELEPDRGESLLVFGGGA